MTTENIPAQASDEPMREAPELTKDVVDSIQWMTGAPDVEGIPQPYAGVIVLLETFASIGMTAWRDGQPTPNSLLCTKFASDLRIATAPVIPVAGAVDRDGRLLNELRDLLTGMSVSVDVSTGDDDAGNRYFGVINEVMDGYHGEKNGVVLLVVDAEPNFAAGAVDDAKAAAISAIRKIIAQLEDDGMPNTAADLRDAINSIDAAISAQQGPEGKQ